MITRTQLKMARAALGWGVRDLARRTGLAANTISRYENGTDALSGTLVRLRMTLEREGLVFLDDDGSGDGVRFKPAVATTDASWPRSKRAAEGGAA
jgi:transcriptional regulator with XRE-family HTH domain